MYNYPQPSQAWLNNDAFASSPNGKMRGVAALLAIFLGSIGIQYFYLGKVGAGVIAIVLSAVTCGCFSVIWLVQGILMFCMNNQDFERKFVTTTSTFPLF
ncbi:MAG: TM2 domain-containing protein [Muribaculaceae bacterium]|nr:TM2 domain-containing protein [Muribaculaceae bacterium]